MLFLNSWRVSVVPYSVTPHPPGIQKQQWHSREAQIEPPLIECEWAFRILEYGRNKGLITVFLKCALTVLVQVLGTLALDQLDLGRLQVMSVVLWVEIKHGCGIMKLWNSGAQKVENAEKGIKRGQLCKTDWTSGIIFFSAYYYYYY
jgi:hypothetical protein